MSMLIQHNLAAMNAQRQFNTVTKSKNKKAERLSSGYRINRAADDAAGLSISEKMRRQIRGLRVGTENAEMGISWVQIGEGALNEAHDILHRMNELSIKAQNGTNTLVDRAYMEAEFEQLQSELDRISTTTTFNELNIFEEHEPVYDQISGNIKWDYEEYHEIVDGRNNELTITYRESAESEAQVLTIKVPPGRYTTHELMDEIDDAFGIDSPIHMEFTEKGFCRLNLEGGEVMDSVTGGLSYLLWDNYDGGGYGTLIGTTEFVDGGLLDIIDGKNDTMSFWIEYFDGSPANKVDIKIQAGKYDKETLMEKINAQIDSKTGIKASDHGDSIMLSSDLGIVTGFKGNMFDIDGPDYSSVFYDNIQKGYVWQDPAAVVGGAVLTTDSRDEEHNRYYIDSTNNKLVLQPNLLTAPVTIEIPVKAANKDDPTKEGYTAQEMVDALNKLFDDPSNGLKGEVKAYLVEYKQRVGFPDDPTKPIGEKKTESVGDDYVIFQGVEIRTVKEGPDAIVNIDKAASTAYDTLFTIKNYNTYGTNAADAKVNNETRADFNASAASYKTYTAGTTNVATFNKNNNKFTITLRSRDQNGGTDFKDTTHVIDVGTGAKNVNQVVSAINTSIAKYADFKDRIKAVYNPTSKRIEIVDKDYTDTDDKVLANVTDPYLNWNTTIEVDSYGSNTGLRTIFEQSYTYYVNQTKTGKGSLTLDKGSSFGTSMNITINGVTQNFSFKGATTIEGIRDAINSKNPIKFSDASDSGSMNGKTVTMKGTGETDVPIYAGDSVRGESERLEGTTRFKKNSPATLAIGPALKSSMEVDSSNNKITLTINGVTKTLTLENSKRTDGAFSAFDTNKDGKYTQAELVEALQAAIDADDGTGFGTGMGGASVSVSGGQLVITCNLPKGEAGKDTTITSYGSGEQTNTFFDYLCNLDKVETAATATSNLDLNASITLADDGAEDIFSFKYTDSTGPHTVTLDLISDGSATKTFTTRQQFVDAINDAIDAITNSDGTKKYKVTAKLSGNKLQLVTDEPGKQTSISYSENSTNKNANTIFAGISNPTKASITLDKAVKESSSEGGTFGLWIDGNYKEVTIGGWNNTKKDQHLDQVLNKQLSSLGVTASLSGSAGSRKLTLTREKTGDGTIAMRYMSSCTSFEKIFGTEADTGVRASVVGTGANKQLRITGGKNDVIAVSSSSSGGMLKQIAKTGYYSAVESGGFHSAKFSTVTSADLSKYVKDGGIELNKWNNELEFEFTKNGTGATEADQKWTKVSFRLTESAPGTKTSIDDVVKELQTNIDAKLGKDVVEVLFDNNTKKLSFKSKKAGAQFQFRALESRATDTANQPDKYKMGGGFFHHVMCQYKTNENKLATPADINGEQYAGDIFAQGRHDVKFDRTKLRPGMSDTLIMDLTFIEDKDHNGKLEDAEIKDPKTITLTLNLDTKGKEWESFGSAELLKMLRKKIDEAIEDPETQAEAKKMGIELHKGLIEVDIGRHNTGVVGNMDDVSFSFTITKNPDIATPVEGSFYIDGIRGNAAYETFYYTEGELIPAYIEGTKDISDGVVLGKDDNQLVFLVDGEMKTVDLSKLEKGKKYSAEEIVQAITDEFKAQNLPLAATITRKGALKISFDRMGKHNIEQVTGSARNKLFFEEHAKKRPHLEREIRVSSNEGDRISVYSPRFSTAMLNINSICISTVKNAEKATNRLKDAIKKVADMRTTFGVIQNRIEHTINNNRNKEENTQAAESRIRDADISQEMMEFSGLNIIQQAGQAILAQANQSRQGMLSLLQ